MIRDNLFSSFKMKRRGFSIIEMVIVIAIIGILAIFALTYYVNVIFDAKMTKTKMLMEQVKNACSRFYTDNGVYPSSVKSLVPKYISPLPKSAWGDAIELSFGEVNEVVTMVPDGEKKRRYPILMDTIGFGKDNAFDINSLSTAVFSFAKTSVSPVGTGEAHLFNVTMQLQFKTVITAKTLSQGADFRFYVTEAEIAEATLQDGTSLEITSRDGERNAFEYSDATKGSETILIKINNCKRSSNIGFELFRPLDEGIPMYYGLKKIIQIGADALPPVTFRRDIGETTRRR